jgi:hypothetical protein
MTALPQEMGQARFVPGVSCSQSVPTGPQDYVPAAGGLSSMGQLFKQAASPESRETPASVRKWKRFAERQYDFTVEGRTGQDLSRSRQRQ